MRKFLTIFTLIVVTLASLRVGLLVTAKTISANRTGLVLDLEMGNSDGSTKVYDRSSYGRTFTGAGALTYVQGTDGYIENDNSANKYITNTDANIFNTAANSIVIKFRPTFSPSDNDTYVLFDSVAPRHSIDKLANADNNVLRIYMGNSIAYDVAEATYSPYWLLNQDNILIVTLTSSANTVNVWLNGTQIVTNQGSAFTPAAEGQFYVGGHTTQGFGGRIYYLKVWNTIISSDAIARYSADRKTYISTSVSSTKIFGTNRTGLTGYWNMNTNDINGSTIYDRNSNDNNGTINGTVTTGRPGIRREAINIDKDTTGYVSFGTINICGTGNFSVSAWVKSETMDRFSTFFDCQNNQGANQGFFFRVSSNNKFQIWVGNGVANDTNDSDSIITTNIWYHITATWNGSQAKMYVNGVLQADVGTLTGPLAFDATRLSQIGRQNVTNYFDGDIDEVKVYNRVLSDADVVNDYNADKITHIR